MKQQLIFIKKDHDYVFVKNGDTTRSRKKKLEPQQPFHSPSHTNSHTHPQCFTNNNKTTTKIHTLCAPQSGQHQDTNKIHESKNARVHNKNSFYFYDQGNTIRNFLNPNQNQTTYMSTIIQTIT